MITCEFFAPPGQSLTLLVCEYGSYTPANGAGDAATETARAGVYTATIAEALSGWHTAHIVAAAGWELPIGDVYLVAGEICRVRDHDSRLSAQVEALQVVPAASGSTPAAGTLTIRRGDQFDATISNLLHLAGRTYMWWTVKSSPERQTDAQAKLQITEDDGLVYLLGEEYATPADGSLTVDDEAGTVQIELAAAVTSWLSAGQRWYWDLQILDADGEPLTIATSTLEVTVDVTRAIEPWEPAE
jgi:hypothetical protein